MAKITFHTAYNVAIIAFLCLWFYLLGMVYPNKLVGGLVLLLLISMIRYKIHKPYQACVTTGSFILLLQVIMLVLWHCEIYLMA